jgi:CheY-like chemotaxis protein
MNKTILLVDDESIFRFIAEKLIRGLGVTDAKILTAENGQQGLDLIRENSQASGSLPRLILVDYYMSPMDGVAFVKSFNTLYTSAREQTIIALTTSSVDSSDIEAAKSVGANHFLPKPLTDASLTSLLKEAGFLL